MWKVKGSEAKQWLVEYERKKKKKRALLKYLSYVFKGKPGGRRSGPLPHMPASSSELSPQSSLPSQTHVCSLHKVLLQMNSSARQKKAPAGTRDTALNLQSKTSKTRFFYIDNRSFCLLKRVCLSFITPSRICESLHRHTGLQRR